MRLSLAGFATRDGPPSLFGPTTIHILHCSFLGSWIKILKIPEINGLRIVVYKTDVAAKTTTENEIHKEKREIPVTLQNSRGAGMAPG